MDNVDIKKIINEIYSIGNKIKKNSEHIVCYMIILGVVISVLKFYKTNKYSIDALFMIVNIAVYCCIAYIIKIILDIIGRNLIIKAYNLEQTYKIQNK